MKISMKDILMYCFRASAVGIVALLIVNLFILAGSFSSSLLSPALLRFFKISSIAGIIFLVALIPLNIIAQRILHRRLHAMSVQETADLHLQQREHIQSSFSSARKRIVRLKRLHNAYTLLLSLLCFYVSFSAGVIDFPWAMPPSTLALWSILWHLRINRVKQTDFDEYASRQDFPHLYALAQRAADKLNMHGKIHIGFIAACTAGIARIGDHFSLLLGAPLLSILTQEELYQVLLHEFSHMEKDTDGRSPELLLYEHLCRLDKIPFSMFLDLYFLYPDALYTYEYSLYRHAASCLLEAEADQAVITHGDPQAMVNALAKLKFHELFEEEIDELVTDLFYENETAPKDNISRLVYTFRDALPERESEWRNLAAHEIQARGASHPIFRHRMEKLGVNEYQICWPEDNTPLRSECRRALEVIDAKVYARTMEDYAEERRQHYLEPIDIIAKWEQANCPLEEESIRPIIHALRSLGKRKEAEALCDRVVLETPNPYASAYARYMKGCFLLERGDQSGIDRLYEAIDLNPNFLSEGLDLIGRSCCKYGWQEALDHYRACSIELVQKYIDERTGDDDLTAKDTLSAEALEGDMLQQILAYIHTIDHGSIREIYLVRKRLSSSSFVSAFVIRFKDNTDEQMIDDVMGLIFEHLDIHPSGWNFSLFQYDQIRAKAVSKVPNSLVYSSEINA